jgi:nitroreductase
MSFANDVSAQLFSEARTFSHWLPRAVAPELLHRLYELAKWGPTSMNASPARFLFLASDEARARLLPALAPGNVAKVQAAPVTAIVASDPAFYEQLPTLFPANPGARDLFAGNAPLAGETAFRNSSLQGAYLILAARLLGLDCGPMSGFDAAAVDAEFFADNGYRTNFLINIGYGDRQQLHPRGPRLGFDEAARIL